MFTIFPVDLMHEVELGVWKALFMHLLRILESVHENLLHELDRRLAIALIKHSLLFMVCGISDFVWYQHLGETQSEGLQLILQISEKWLPGIMRIYFKCVSFILSPRPLL